MTAEIREVECNDQPFFRSLTPRSLYLVVSKPLSQLAWSPSSRLKSSRWLKLPTRGKENHGAFGREC
ncbi:MAG: hypothetical protein KF751_20230 [Nitrospira sp.]|nr:hypothetical protein [Nitrospira sp.]